MAEFDQTVKNDVDQMAAFDQHVENEVDQMAEFDKHVENEVDQMAEFDQNVKHDFDLEIVLAALKRCHKDDDVLDLAQYLSAYHELCRFFQMTGRLFGYVGKDLDKKVRDIEVHKNSSNGCHYKTVHGMLDYELENGFSKKKKMGPHRVASGSRTLLRLHHAFEFILEFMRRVELCKDDDRMSHVAWKVYIKTLANHHPWFVRKVAAVGVYALPSRRHLIKSMCKQEPEAVHRLVGEVVAAGKPIYDIMQRLYSERDLLRIP